jgi:transposase
VNVATGKVIGRCSRRHRHTEFLTFLDHVDASLPPTGEGHVIMDNYGTHKVPKVARWFARHPRYHVHVTPTSASWLNQVQRFFSDITTKRIRRGTFDNVRALDAAIEWYLTHHNAKAKTVYLDGDCGCHHRQGQTILRTNFGDTTLARSDTLPAPESEYAREAIPPVLPCCDHSKRRHYRILDSAWDRFAQLLLRQAGDKGLSGLARSRGQGRSPQGPRSLRRLARWRAPGQPFCHRPGDQIKLSETVHSNR